MNDKTRVSFWKLMWLFIKVTIFSFGGGNAIFPMIKSYCVDRYQWLTNEDIDDILIVTNLLPGPSGVEAMTYIAYLLLKSKWKSALLTFFALLPHTIIFFILFYLGNKFIPTQYLKVIYVAVIPVIIILLIQMSIRYIKVENKQFSIFLHWIILIITVGFTVFVPVPYSVPIIVIAFFFLLLLIYELVRRKKKKGDQ